MRTLPRNVLRPYIPWLIREKVIDRQMINAGLNPSWAANHVKSAEKRVKWKLEEFFGETPVELHHRPSLINRPLRNGKYDPDANDPTYLVYLPADEHDIETRVHGQHGQYSDLALARKRKRIERKKTKRKHKWPKRKFG